jgi:hypothetical protein
MLVAYPQQFSTHFIGGKHHNTYDFIGNVDMLAFSSRLIE